MISSMLLLIYFYGNINPVKVHLISDGQYLRTYRFNLSSDENVLHIIEYFNKTYETEKCSFVNYYDYVQIEYRKNDIKLEKFYNVMCVNYGPQKSSVGLAGRNEFTDSEVSNAENVIIISESLAIKLKNNINYGEDKLTINNVDYTIIGKSTGNDLLIPNTTFAKNNFETNSVIITATKKPSYYKNIEFIKSISKEFDNISSVSSHPYSEYDNILKKDTPLVYALMAVIFASMIIAFMFLLKHLSDNTNYISIIYSICGASRETVLFIKLATIFILTLLTSLLGVLIHIITYNTFFKSINIVENLYYDFNDYSIIIMMACIASVVISIPFIITFSRNTSIINKNKFC